MSHSLAGGRRWIALIVLCVGVLMIVLDSTIVNVALPSIRADLAFSETSLVWVINAYLLTYGGFLLLGGRLGDLYGQRRLLLLGVVAFTLASLACGLARSQATLICARAVQGLGGAVVSSSALSTIMNLFPEPDERTRAMGIYGFVCSSGGVIGVLLGGVLTSAFSWHWIFLVNLPIGALVYGFCMILISPSAPAERTGRLDIAGAVTVTTSLMLAVYAIVNGNQVGWLSGQSVGLIGAAAVLLGLFLLIESRVRAPLMPLRLFRSRSISTANIIAVLWAAAVFAWFFLCALYLQRVLGYDAIWVSLAFLPANILSAVMSLGFSAKLVMRFGIRIPLTLGLLLPAMGLALFALAPVNGSFVWNVMPGMILVGLGAGVAFNPLLLAAMKDVTPSESGLASGVVNTAFMMGGALGLAILASAAAARTGSLIAQGADQVAALNGGFHVAFGVGALSAVIAAVLGVTLPETKEARAPAAQLPETCAEQ